MQLTVLTTTDPLLRDLVGLTLAQMADVLACSLDLPAAEVTLTLHRGLEREWSRSVELAHPCISCSLREVVVPALVDLMESGQDQLVLSLPAGVEPLHVVPALAEIAAHRPELTGLRITCCLHAVNQDTVRRDLLSHVSLADAGLDLADAAERCVGEVLLTSLGYADVILAVGQDELGGDLVEHLRAFETLRIDNFAHLTSNLLFGGEHSVDDAVERVHPTTTAAWGGPSERGVWTLDLHSDRPFHPARLRQWAAELAGQDACARGCFWLPSRPGTICTWEVSGATTTVGTAGSWDGEDAFTHIVVTGTGSASVRQTIRDAFHKILMSPAEMPGALTWVGADDGLGEWFPDWDED